MADTEHEFAPEDVGLNAERLNYIADYFDKAYVKDGKLPCMATMVSRNGQIVHETYRTERDSYKLDLSINGQDRIELFSFPHPPERPSYPEARGLRHLAFAVEDLDAQVAQLKEHSIPTEAIRIDEITGQRFTFCQDPDGLPLELYERR